MPFVSSFPFPLVSKATRCCVKRGLMDLSHSIHGMNSAVFRQPLPSRVLSRAPSCHAGGVARSLEKQVFSIGVLNSYYRIAQRFLSC